MHYGLVSGPGKIPCQELSVSVRLGCESRRARGNVEGGQRVLFSLSPAEGLALFVSALSVAGTVRCFQSAAHLFLSRSTHCGPPASLRLPLAALK